MGDLKQDPVQGGGDQHACNPGSGRGERHSGRRPVLRRLCPDLDAGRGAWYEFPRQLVLRLLGHRIPIGEMTVREYLSSSYFTFMKQEW